MRSIAGQLLARQKKSVPKLSKEQLAQYKHGQQIHKSLCSGCHGDKAQGVKFETNGTVAHLAPPLANNPRVKGNPELSIKTMLHGLTGELDGVAYSGNMISMAGHGDAWIADVLSYLRYEYNNKASFISAADVKRIKEANLDRKKAWTQAELEASLPPTLKNQKEWLVSAKANSSAAKNAIDGNPETRYTSGAPMNKGMWFQVELPSPTTLTGCVLEFEKSPQDFPREYILECSSDGKAWSTLAKGNGSTHTLSIQHAPTETKFIRVTQTGRHPKMFWSIHELQLVGTR